MSIHQRPGAITARTSAASESQEHFSPSAKSTDPDVLLVRHGETPMNRDGRVQGWTDASLSTRGKEQARAAGQHIAQTYNVDTVIASDLERAVSTAETIAAYADTGRVTIDSRWREQNFGTYEGMDSADFEREVADIAPSERLAGGESLQDVRRRVRNALRDVETTGTTVVVSHAVSIAQLLGSIHGCGLAESFDRFDPDNAAVTSIAHENEWEIQQTNFSAF